MMNSFIPRQNQRAMLVVLIKQKPDAKLRENPRTLTTSFGGHRQFKRTGETLLGSEQMGKTKQVILAEGTKLEGQKKTTEDTKQVQPVKKPVDSEKGKYEDSDKYIEKILRHIAPGNYC